MKTTFSFFASFILGLFLFSCQSIPKSNFNEEVEKKKILELNAMDDSFLLNQDLSLYRKLLACSADSTLMINRGNVNWNKKMPDITDDQIMKDFGFDNLQYTKIENLIEPVIRFSPDGKMAFETGQIKYFYETKDSLGNKKNGEFIDAWLSVYEKRDSCWLEVAIAQTFNN